MNSMVAPPLAQTSVQTGTTPDVLHRITRPGSDMVVWQRSNAMPWTAWLNALPSDALPVGRLMLQPAEALAALHETCKASGTPMGNMRDLFTFDVADLVGRFAAITGTDTVALRMDLITGNACRRWHRDCLPLRLICTYRGPSTLWVPPALAALALNHAEDELASQASQLQTGDVALLKGCGWAEQTHDAGTVHRSPRMEGTGLVRLVLVLDLPPEKRSNR
ncbi:MAG: hypothetical protein C0453_01140 [Comamonadaceae bacterium]|nr:hypothetical protein [Comamonadaceae bacterium]